ncbi:MAG: sulfatase-like hydrolase/transferase, partial [Bacteroidales bacterium]|nr:sulfatase-like hydrolase/transferase [Bacteroidales bacterium]
LRFAYYRLCEAVDAEIGKIVDEIDRQNLWKDTVVIFASDHGDGHGAHQWNQKTALYEEVNNVPFIVCVPGGRNAGKVSEALVNSCIDLMPSICDWTGAEMPAGRHGRSFRSYAEKGAEGPEYIVTETNFNQTSGTFGWMVRSARYKYVLYDKGQYREMLYDMSSDRGEMTNLAVEARYADIVREHRAVLRQWIEEHSRFRSRHLKFIPE